MKKFRVELTVYTKQTVFYEVEAKNREDLENKLRMECVEDIGECVDEETPEFYEEVLGEIKEVKNV